MCRTSIYTSAGPVSVGTRIRIVKMDDKNGKDKQATEYSGREGVVKTIDGAGQLHGSWGGIAVIPEIDSFMIL